MKRIFLHQLVWLRAADVLQEKYLIYAIDAPAVWQVKAGQKFAVLTSRGKMDSNTTYSAVLKKKWN